MQIAGVPTDRLIRLCRTPTLIVKRTVDAAFAQGSADVLVLPRRDAG